MKKFTHGLFIFLAVFAATSIAPAKDAPHDFAKWEKAIAVFEAHDRTNSPPTNAILFIGSSTIRFWTNLPADFPEYQIINRGFGGSEIVDATHFAGRLVFPYSPRAIFFRAGGNDIAAGRAPAKVFGDFKEFVATVHAKLPDTDIYFISWAPTPLRWNNRDQEKILNDAAEAFARTEPHVRFIEAGTQVLGSDGTPREELFRADKLHFNSEGYKLLAERVRPFLPK